MAKKIKVVKSKNNNNINVMCGFGQDNYVAGDVWRVPADLYADVADVAKIDVNDKNRFDNTLKVLLDAFNEKHESQLVSTEYDVKSGKFDRATPVPQAQVEEQPVMAVADTTPKDPMADWINQQFKSGQEEDDIIDTLKAQKWSDEQLKPYFKSLQPSTPQPPKAPSVPTIPQPPQ